MTLFESKSTCSFNCISFYELNIVCVVSIALYCELNIGCISLPCLPEISPLIFGLHFMHIQYTFRLDTPATVTFDLTLLSHRVLCLSAMPVLIPNYRAHLHIHGSLIPRSLPSTNLKEIFGSRIVGAFFIACSAFDIVD